MALQAIGRGFESHYLHQYVGVMELAYISASSTEFCGFESHLRYQPHGIAVVGVL